MHYYHHIGQKIEHSRNFPKQNWSMKDLSNWGNVGNRQFVLPQAPGKVTEEIIWRLGIPYSAIQTFCKSVFMVPSTTYSEFVDYNNKKKPYSSLFSLWGMNPRSSDSKVLHQIDFSGRVGHLRLRICKPSYFRQKTRKWFKNMRYEERL